MTEFTIFMLLKTTPAWLHLGRDEMLPAIENRLAA